MENGYHLYDFKGTLLREEHIDRFIQFLWRPRPPTLLTKDDQKNIRKNLRDYSRQFDEEDQYELDTANMAVVETRRAQLGEWLEWRELTELDLEEERKELGVPPEGPIPVGLKGVVSDGKEEIIEEIVEEVISEEEEIIS
jgi:translation initiation factor 3 subunit B